MKTTGLVKPDSAENATIPAHFGAHDLAQILGLSRQAVHKRATTEQSGPRFVAEEGLCRLDKVTFLNAKWYHISQAVVAACARWVK